MDSSNQVPDGDTIGRFRALLVEHGLQEKLFTQVVELLLAKGLILKKGSIVDSTIISAPCSTKNREKKRDPDVHQTKKGTAWHFGYKGHIGVDTISGLVHHVEVTAANVHDVIGVPRLLHGEEESVHGDSGYLGADKREDAITHNSQGKKILYKINRRPSQSKNISTRSKGQIKRREVIRAGKGRACFRCSDGAVWLSQDPVQRPTKTDRKTKYDVRPGEPGSGGQAFRLGCLIRVPFA